MTLLAWLAWGEWRAQPVRNALSVAAIAIGVALGFAVHLVNAVALDNFTGGLNKLRGAADLQVVSRSGNGFDEAVYGRLMTGPTAATIAVASPIVERDVAPQADATLTLRITGLDLLRAARVTPALVGRPDASAQASDDRSADAANAANTSNASNASNAASSDDPTRASGWFDDDALYVEPALLARLGKRVGDDLAVQVDGRSVPLRIAGRLSDDDPMPGRRRLRTRWAPDPCCTRRWTSPARSGASTDSAG